MFITYSFPPDAEVGGKRTARFCRYLPEFGFAPAVLTANERLYKKTDNSFIVPPGVELIRTNAFRNPLEWYRSLPKFKRGTNGTAPRNSAFDNRGRSGLYEILRRNTLLAVQTPDCFWGWYWHAVRAGVSYVRRRAVPIIISSGPPWTSHLAARGIKRKTGALWIADFRDPWTLNAWRTRLPEWLERFDQRLERTVVMETDRIVCTTGGMAENFRSKYNQIESQKFITITNGIDGDYPVPAAAEKPSARRHLVHLGSLYGDRQLRPLLQAILKLISASKIDPNLVRLSFAGSIDEAVLQEAQAEISALQRCGMIHICGLLPYQAGQTLLSSADVLLLIQGNNPDAVPAKFYEYLVTSKPILALAKPGALSQLIVETGVGFCADPDDPDAIATGLLRCIESTPLNPAEYDQLRKRFHFRTLTAQLVDVMRELEASGSKARDLPARSLRT